MIIRKAVHHDIGQICRIYEDILKLQNENIIYVGWQKGVYPTEKTALAALEKDELFVGEENGEVIACAIINQTQAPAYKEAQWQYKCSDSEIMVLHTLVVKPLQSKKGIGTKMVSFYEQYALEHNCPYLRMDTNEKNLTARKMYEKLGYKEVGIVPCVFNGIDGVNLVCLEKYIN